MNQYVVPNGSGVGVPAASAPDIFIIVNSESEKVIRIAKDGRLFWHQREAETDDDFRAAMMELAKRLVGVQ